MTACNIKWSEMTKHMSGLLITVSSEVAMIFHMDTCFTHIHKLPCLSLTYDVPLCVCVCCGQLCLTLRSMDCCWTPLFMGFFRQEYWSGLPVPSPGQCSYLSALQ